MFKTLLIANRAEIACRVIRTARRMGVATVAVYSDADRNAMHVCAADMAFHIGGSEAKSSYLRAEAILKAAKDAGADAIHPGYGFLSENASFAEACVAAGIVFVGPPASAIRAMGLKDAAKELMSKSGVPIVPGYHGKEQSPSHLQREADRIGYPVLIKAVAGGGGKGMRRVDEAGAFAAALDSAKREAISAFGDDRVLIEKYITCPRHIEMQVFADAHGNAIHLFERDCSLQRRYQKVIEEAPAPGMPEVMREKMGNAAVTAAKAIGYRGAGTVEFIADASEGLSAERFWFMEMNTRLQVEHPVTEMITGIDLVEWQLRVASGENLPLRQDEVSIRGHAVEARLYAEDPARQFLPSIGTLARLRLPHEDRHVRVDTGVRQGDAVSMFYDPMIAKIIAWDGDRGRALARLGQAMRQVEVAGVRTNAAFIVEIVGHGSFGAGDIDTGFIDRHLASLLPAAGDASPVVLALAAIFIIEERRQVLDARSGGARKISPWDVADGFRVGGNAREELTLIQNGKPVVVGVSFASGAHKVLVGAVDMQVSGDLDQHGNLVASVNGARVVAGAIRVGRDIVIMIAGATHVFGVPDPLDAEDVEGQGSDRAVAPMSGKIVQVFVKNGDAARKGQALVILEAMKMEHTLAAPADVKIAEICVSAGDQVSEGCVLVRFATE